MVGVSCLQQLLSVLLLLLLDACIHGGREGSVDYSRYRPLTALLCCAAPRPT